MIAFLTTFDNKTINEYLHERAIALDLISRSDKSSVDLIMSNPKDAF